MSEKVVCPKCGNPLDGTPPDICSPLRCDVWVTTRIYDHASREWVSLDDLNAVEGVEP